MQCCARGSGSLFRFKVRYLTLGRYLWVGRVVRCSHIENPKVGIIDVKVP